MKPSVIPGFVRSSEHRLRNSGAPREPLATVAELADRLGVHAATLYVYLRRPDAPAPRRGKSVTAGAYFSPSAVVKWWNQIKQEGERND